MKKLVTWVAIAFVVFYLVTEPASAASLVRDGLGLALSGGHALAAFVNSLAA